jgi:membrane protein DedA with SNARE-associated domain
MDLTTPTGILSYMQGISYFILFLLFFFEGPLVNYVAAFASSLGFFNVFIVLILAVTADFLGDIVYYMIGRVGKKNVIRRLVAKTLNPERYNRIRGYLDDNLGKTMFVFKMTPIIAGPGLIIAGAMHVKLKEFLIYSIFFCIIRCSVIIMLGYYSGILFEALYKYVQYGSYLAGAFILIIFVSMIFIKFKLQKLSSRIEKI